MINLYCYQNKINGKVNIGQTKDTLEVRAGKDFIKYKGCVKFYNALNKYKLEGFERWIFKVVDTKEEADQEERFWIAEMRKILGKDNVYNIQDGGINGEGNKGHKAWNKGKKMSTESKEKMSMSAIKRGSNSPETEFKKGQKAPSKAFKKGNIPWIKGKNHSKESKEKMSISHKGKNTGPRKLTLEQVKYIKISNKSARQLAKEFNTTHKTIQEWRNK